MKRGNSLMENSSDELQPEKLMKWSRYSMERVHQTMGMFEQQISLSASEVLQILDDSIAMFDAMPNVLSLWRPTKAGGKMGPFTICGDTHGQYDDVMKIFSDDVAGFPSAENPFLFNGDFVDRGQHDIEIALLLLLLKLASPECIHILRGNHETLRMNHMFGFKSRVEKKYNRDVYKRFLLVFHHLPVAAVLESTVFVCHGGIHDLSQHMTIAELNQLDRKKHPEGAIHELLWSDPSRRNGVHYEIRNKFGPDVTERFLQINGLSSIVRSHEFKKNGYGFTHNKKCLTVFSASNYTGQMKNFGAVLRFEKEDSMKRRLLQFVANESQNETGNVGDGAYDSGKNQQDSDEEEEDDEVDERTANDSVSDGNDDLVMDEPEDTMLATAEDLCIDDKIITDHLDISPVFDYNFCILEI